MMEGGEPKIIVPATEAMLEHPAVVDKLRTAIPLLANKRVALVFFERTGKLLAVFADGKEFRWRDGFGSLNYLSVFESGRPQVVAHAPMTDIAAHISGSHDLGEHATSTLMRGAQVRLPNIPAGKSWQRCLDGTDPKIVVRATDATLEHPSTVHFLKSLKLNREDSVVLVFFALSDKLAAVFKNGERTFFRPGFRSVEYSKVVLGTCAPGAAPAHAVLRAPMAEVDVYVGEKHRAGWA